MQRKGYILVAENDDLIRALLERWLGEAGYGVRLASATLAADAPVEAPLLIIANVPSPLSGEALLRELREAHEAPILAISARFRRGLRASVDVARQMGVRYVLPKPFTRKELLAAVRESLAGAA